MNYKQNTTFFLFLLLGFYSRLAQGACLNVTGGNCTAGCWNPDDLILDNGSRVCVAVEAGYYSPAHSNERIACPFGHISEQPEAAQCDICPPGSVAHLLNTHCALCFVGSYTDLPGQEGCVGCNPSLYSGTGSTNRSVDGFCIRDSPAPSMAPSSIPTSQPSAQPSSLPTLRPSLAPSLRPSDSPSSEPSALPSHSPSLFPSESPSFIPSQEPTLAVSVPLELDEGVCESDEQIFHGVCAHCPNLFQYIFFPSLALGLGLVMALYYFLTAPQGTPNVFILIDFMQKLYLIGTTHAPWPAIMKWMFQVCGLFALDLDVIAPPQCIFGMSQQASKVFIGMIPFIWVAVGVAGIKLWTTHRETPSGPPMKRFIGTTMIALVLFYMTLVRASLEAIQCSPVYDAADEDTSNVDWMCSENGTAGDKFIAWFCVFTGLLYGIGYPFALLVLLARYKEDVHKEKIADASDESQTDVESQQGRVAALREQAAKTEPNPIKDAMRPFITMFTEQKWRWAFWLLVHKMLSVVFVVFAGENIILSHVLLVVIELFVGVFTLCESPYEQDFESDSESQTEVQQRSFQPRPYQTLETVLRGISIVVLVFGVVLQVMDSAAESRVLIGVLGFGLPVAGLVCVIAKAIQSIKERDDKEIAKVGNENKDGDSSLNVVRRKTEQAEDESNTKGEEE